MGHKLSAQRRNCNTAKSGVSAADANAAAANAAAASLPPTHPPHTRCCPCPTPGCVHIHLADAIPTHQVAVIEFARNVLGITDADSTEFNPATPHPAVVFMPEISTQHMGGTMRLGGRRTVLQVRAHAFAAAAGIAAECTAVQVLSYAAVCPDLILQCLFPLYLRAVDYACVAHSGLQATAQLSACWGFS